MNPNDHVGNLAAAVREEVVKRDLLPGFRRGPAHWCEIYAKDIQSSGLPLKRRYEAVIDILTARFSVTMDSPEDAISEVLRAFIQYLDREGES